MAVTILDPTGERTTTTRPLTERPSTLTGRTVGLVDISKPRGDVFCDRIAEHLMAAGAIVERYTKPAYTKPAPPDLRAEIAARCEVVIQALAD